MIKTHEKKYYKQEWVNVTFNSCTELEEIGFKRNKIKICDFLFFKTYLLLLSVAAVTQIKMICPILVRLSFQTKDTMTCKSIATRLKLIKLLFFMVFGLLLKSFAALLWAFCNSKVKLLVDWTVFQQRQKCFH